MKKSWYRRKRTRGVLAAIAAAALAILYWPEISAFLGRFDWLAIRDAVRTSGPWAPVLCILLNALFTVLILPTTLVSILVALLFGVWFGLAICLAGLGLGMAAAFLIARYGLRDWLERRIGDTKLYRRLEENMRRDGWKLVLFMRLLPITPYSFLNYAFGLTGIRFWPYFLASLVGIVPNVLALLWTANAAGQLAAGRMDWRIVVLLFSGAGLFAALAWLPRLLRRNMPEALPAPGDDEAEPEE